MTAAEDGSKEPQEPMDSPEAGTGTHQAFRRPRNLMLIALGIGGLWPSFWFAGVLLIPLSFWLTWPGRWMPRHWIMTASGLIWAAALAVRLSGSQERAELGLDGWNPPEWMLALSGSAPLVVMAVQIAAIGAFVWALWSQTSWLNGRDPQS